MRKPNSREMSKVKSMITGQSQLELSVIETVKNRSIVVFYLDYYYIFIQSKLHAMKIKQIHIKGLVSSTRIRRRHLQKLKRGYDP